MALTQEDMHRRSIEDIEEELKEVENATIPDIKKQGLYRLGGIITTAMRLEAISHDEFWHYVDIEQDIWDEIINRAKED